MGLGSLGLGRLHERPGFPWALAHGSHGTQRDSTYELEGGRDTAWERLVRGGEPPHGPHKPNLVSFTSRFTSIFNITSKFTNNLGLIACKLITICLIFLHVVIQTCTCFFFEIPRIEELQDPDSSPRREEVGRRTLGVNGGFLPAFFYRASFHLFTQQFPLRIDEPQKLSLRSL